MDNFAGYNLDHHSMHAHVFHCEGRHTLRGLNVKKALRKSATPEGAVVKAICEYLAIVRNQTKIIDFWIQRKTGVFDTGTNKFRKRTGPFERNGIADISGIIKGGRRLEIEVKRPRARTPAIKQCSDEQVKFLSKINAMGGLAFAASSVQEVKQLLEEHVLDVKNPDSLL